jgi:hypothetical protein
MVGMKPLKKFVTKVRQALKPRNVGRNVAYEVNYAILLRFQGARWRLYDLNHLVLTRETQE